MESETGPTLTRGEKKPNQKKKTKTATPRRTLKSTPGTLGTPSTGAASENRFSRNGVECPVDKEAMDRIEAAVFKEINRTYSALNEERTIKFFRKFMVKQAKSELPKGTKVRTKGRVDEKGNVIIDVWATPPPGYRFIDITIDTKTKEKT